MTARSFPATSARTAAGPATPLAALDAVSLDTETTGLDVREARIVEIGAVRLHGSHIARESALEMRINPGVAIPEQASRIHGIRDTDVADAPPTAAGIRRLAAFVGNAPVIGHSIAFDLAVLRFEAHRHGVPWAEPRTVDIALLAAALEPARVDNSLEALAASYGVAVERRHSALGDALTAAQIFLAMLPELRAAGVRTLAEATAFERRATELMEQQEHAGWHARPGAPPDYAAAIEALPSAQPAIDSFLYRHRLVDVMGTPPVTVAPDATLVEAARVMRRHGLGCLVVEPLEDGGSGFLSERDVLRVFAERGAAAAEVPVAEVMSRPVISLPEDTFLYRALGMMARRSLRYLAVTGPDGRVTGVFTLRSLLRERALSSLALGDQIVAAESATQLARARAELPRLAAGLLADGLEARQVAAIISAEERAMTARAGELAEGIMIEEGRGPAPAGFCLLVLGSAGRGESLLAPDQDNALVVDDAYTGALDAEDDWFALWSTHVNRILDEAGLPLCKGGVMVRNRDWRRTLAEWRRQVDTWAARSEPQNLLNVDIFYDFAPVLGQRSLAATLREHALDAAARAPLLIRALAEEVARHGAALGLFGGFRKDDRGRTDLKAGGLLPLVSGARALALAFRIEATATPERLLAATERAGAGRSDADTLIEIHEMILRLILRQQIADIAAGVPPSNAVDTSKLSRRERKALRRGLEQLDLMAEMVQGVLH